MLEIKFSAERKKARGVALIMVLMVIALVAAVVVEFQYSSKVSYQVAIGERDSIQAEYNALGALYLRAALLKNAATMNAAMGSVSSQLGLPSIQKILDVIPIDCAYLGQIFTIDTFGQSETSEPSVILPGECKATSEKESTKISLNGLRSNDPKKVEATQLMLLGILQNPKFRKYFEDSQEVNHAENPQELVNAIVGWMNGNLSASASLTTDRYYEALSDPYHAKKAPFDSVQELGLVHGVNQELLNLLKRYVSIYTDGGALDLSSASIPFIVVEVAALAGKGVNLLDPMDPRILQLWKLLQTQNELSMGFGSIQLNALKSAIDLVGLGDMISKESLATIFSDKSPDVWFTLESEGKFGQARRRIHAVYQAKEDTFYYFRID
jgi:Type II secretion system (T2SS), protein K